MPSKAKHVFPSSGGSYARDPETGELTPNTKAEKRDNPASSSRKSNKGKGKSSGKSAKPSGKKSNGETPKS